jgi:hypothetical protein
MKLILHMLLIVSMQVQAEPSIDNEDESKLAGRLAWFAYSHLPETVQNPVKIISGKDLLLVTLSKRRVSEPVKIPQDGVLRLVREEPDPDKPGKMLLITIAEALIPQEVKEALVILIPLSKPDGNRLFRTKIQTLEEFRGGDWLFMNLTNAEIGIRLGGVNTLVKPNGIGIRSNRDLSGPVNMDFNYNYKLAGETEWRLLTASTTVVMPSRREICIFSVNPHNSRISYNGLTFPVE